LAPLHQSAFPETPARLSAAPGLRGHPTRLLLFLPLVQNVLLLESETIEVSFVKHSFSMIAFIIHIQRFELLLFSKLFPYVQRRQIISIGPRLNLLNHSSAKINWITNIPTAIKVPVNRSTWPYKPRPK